PTSHRACSGSAWRDSSAAPATRSDGPASSTCGSTTRTRSADACRSTTGPIAASVNTRPISAWRSTGTCCRRLEGDHMRAFTVSLLVVLSLTAAPHADSALDDLARDVDRTESLRAVLNLTRVYDQHAQAASWNAVGALFAADGRFVFDGLIKPEQTIKGPSAI